MDLSTYLPIYPIYLIHLPIDLTIYLSTYLPIYLSTYLPSWRMGISRLCSNLSCSNLLSALWSSTFMAPKTQASRAGSLLYVRLLHPFRFGSNRAGSLRFAFLCCICGGEPCPIAQPVRDVSDSARFAPGDSGSCPRACCI